MPDAVEETLPDLGEVGVGDGIVGLAAEPRGERANGAVAGGSVAGGEALRDDRPGDGGVHGRHQLRNPRSQTLGA